MSQMVVAYNALHVRPGKPVWTFHPVPRPGEFGHDTWAGDSWKDRSGVNNWGFMDTKSQAPYQRIIELDLKYSF